MKNLTTTRPLEMLLTLNNPVFGCYIYWSSILIIKMLLMSILTAVQRFRFKIPENVDETLTLSLCKLWANKNARLLSNHSAILGVLFQWFLNLKNTYVNPEDGIFSRKESTVELSDPHVDRVRRAHLNDMENILPFFTMGLMYICTDPCAILAMILIRIQAVARIIHTLVYAFGPVPQPSRAISFFVGFSITIYMGLYTLCRTITFI